MKKVNNVKECNGISKKVSLKALSLLLSGVMATSLSACDSKKKVDVTSNNGIAATQYLDTNNEELPSLLGSIEIKEDGQIVDIPVYKNVYESVLPIEEYKNYAGFEHNTYDSYDEIVIDAIKVNKGKFEGSRPKRNINDEIMFFMNIPKSYDLDKIKEDYPESEGYTVVDNGKYYEVRRMNEVIYTAPNGFVRKGDKVVMSANLVKKTVQEFETARIVYDSTITEEDYSLYEGFNYIEGEENDFVEFTATRRVIYTAPINFTLKGEETQLVISNSTNGVTDELREKYPESEGYTITEDGNTIVITHPVIENIEYLIPEGFNITVRNGIVYACKHVDKNNKINKLTKGLK